MLLHRSWTGEGHGQHHGTQRERHFHHPPIRGGEGERPTAEALGRPAQEKTPAAQRPGQRQHGGRGGERGGVLPQREVEATPSFTQQEGLVTHSSLLLPLSTATRSSEEEFVVSDNESEAETDASNNSDNAGGRHRTSSRARSPLQQRRSSRRRRRPKGYSDDEEEETDEEEEDEIGR